MREIFQLKQMGKRMLTRVRSYLTVKHLSRNQFMFKEGEIADTIYIIKEGSLQVTKNIYDHKIKNLEHKLLTT